MSGSVLLHHFVTVGTLAFVGGGARVRADVPPYMIYEGEPARVRKINVEGLQRRSVSPSSKEALREAFRHLYRSESTLSAALDTLEGSPLSKDAHVANLIAHHRRSIAGQQGRALEAHRGDVGIKSTTIINSNDPRVEASLEDASSSP